MGTFLQKSSSNWYNKIPSHSDGSPWLRTLVLALFVPILETKVLALTLHSLAMFQIYLIPCQAFLRLCIAYLLGYLHATTSWTSSGYPLLKPCSTWDHGQGWGPSFSPGLPISSTNRTSVRTLSTTLIEVKGER